MKQPLACIKCRTRKRKCDRAYPTCSYCLRTHDRCIYRTTSVSGQPPVRLSLPQISYKNDLNLTTSFNEMFLGYPFFPHRFTDDNDANISIPSDLRSFVVDDENIPHYIADFPEKTGLYCMPFIPRQDLQVKLLDQTRQLNGAAVLVVACIKVLCQHVEDNPRSNPQYLAIKSIFISAEVNGVLTVRLLQALLLLLFYEFGHGVYPSAYITLGTCTRYLTAIGINEASLAHESANEWIITESRRRLWWSVYSMERIMMLGNPTGSLILKEPDQNEPLPSDDRSWDQAYPSVDAHLTLLSPAMSKMSSFRQLVHAAYLIGRVLQHASDHHLPPQLYNEKGTQLHRTILSLLTVIDAETNSALVPVSVPRIILNSAVFLLHSIFVHNKDESNAEHIQQTRLFSAEIYLYRLRVYLEGKDVNVLNLNPFLLHWGFHVYQYYYVIYRKEGHSENLQAVKDILKGFEILGEKWRISDIYVTLLNNMQESQ